MFKEIEKYVGFYLLTYIIILFICGFFQYIAVCQGQSLSCSFSMTGINTIITTTAYVITPIVAIIGFISWKVQYNIQLEKNDLRNALKAAVILKENINYFEVHLNNLYVQIQEVPVKNFETLISHYDENKVEIRQKRRELSLKNTIKYYSCLEICQHPIPESQIDFLYNHNNEFEGKFKTIVFGKFHHSHTP